MFPQFDPRSSRLFTRLIPITAFVTTLTLAMATTSSAQVAPAERLCDNAFEDCRATILDMIRNEKAGIDVSYWFMTDWRYSSEIIKRWQAGVPVRILLDLRADPGYPAGVSIRQSFIDAGIPIRHKVTTGINHWKMMLYRGQSAVHFSAANFANGSYSPSEAGGEYRRYVDEAAVTTARPTTVIAPQLVTRRTQGTSELQRDHPPVLPSARHSRPFQRGEVNASAPSSASVTASSRSQPASC